MAFFAPKSCLTISTKSDGISRCPLVKKMLSLTLHSVSLVMRDGKGIGMMMSPSMYRLLPPFMGAKPIRMQSIDGAMMRKHAPKNRMMAPSMFDFFLVIFLALFSSSFLHPLTAPERIHWRFPASHESITLIEC